MKDYRETMRDLSFTQEQKDAMVEELMAAAQPAKRQVSHRRVLAIAAAAAMLTLTVTAGATGVLPSPQAVFSSLFGGDPAQTEIIDQIGHPIGASHTADGVTITADAIIGDTHSYAIVYSIQREDGTPLAEDIPETNGVLSLDFSLFGTDLDVMAGSHGTSFFYDADPSDSAIQYVEMMTYDTPITGGIASAEFRDLTLVDLETYERTTLADGPWKLSFEFAFEDATLSLPAGQTFQVSGMPATLDAVYLSSLSILVEVTVEGDPETYTDAVASAAADGTAAPQPSQKYVEHLPILIHLSDGTTLDMTNSGCSVTKEDGYAICQKGELFPSILPLDTIESITIGDLTIPVEAP